jgi:hypothetical protein
MTTLVASAPERSLAQRHDALQRANEIRTRRAQLKRDVKAGRADALAVLADPPEWAGTMKVVDLMLAVPSVGRVKVNKALRRCAVSPSKSLGGLSTRQRAELRAHLEAAPALRRRGA